MAELKTQRNDGDVDAFLSSVPDDRRPADARAVCALMADVTGEPPVLWGKDIVGFGTLRYRYADGRRAEWFVVGFSPRKQSLTLYLMSGFEHRSDLLERLGPHTTGKACLYVKRLAAVDLDVLRELVVASMAASRKAEPPE